ncbi:MAG: hypothetical protein D6773_11340, partial [Alphaproteobacteria bacterium]
MALVPLTLPAQSNPGRYGPDGAARLINCYAEQRGAEGKIPLPLYAVDGLSAFATLTDGADCRGLFADGATLFAVSGRLLFTVDTTGTATTVGGIPGDGRVYFARNQKANTPQVAIVSEDGQRFIYENGALFEITDPDLPPPNSVAFVDGYTIFGIPDGRFFYSAIDEASQISATDFAEAEG